MIARLTLLAFGTVALTGWSVCDSSRPPGIAEQATYWGPCPETPERLRQQQERVEYLRHRYQQSEYARQRREWKKRHPDGKHCKLSACDPR